MDRKKQLLDKIAGREAVIGIVGLALEYALIKLATAFTFEEVKS